MFGFCSCRTPDGAFEIVPLFEETALNERRNVVACHASTGTPSLKERCELRREAADSLRERYARPWTHALLFLSQELHVEALEYFRSRLASSSLPAAPPVAPYGGTEAAVVGLQDIGAHASSGRASETVEAGLSATGAKDPGIVHGLLSSLRSWSLRARIIAYRGRVAMPKAGGIQERRIVVVAGVVVVVAVAAVVVAVVVGDPIVAVVVIVVEAVVGALDADAVANEAVEVVAAAVVVAASAAAATGVVIVALAADMVIAADHANAPAPVVCAVAGATAAVVAAVAVLLIVVVVVAVVVAVVVSSSSPPSSPPPASTLLRVRPLARALKNPSSQGCSLPRGCASRCVMTCHDSHGSPAPWS